MIIETGSPIKESIFNEMAIFLLYIAFKMRYTVRKDVRVVRNLSIINEESVAGSPFAQHFTTDMKLHLPNLLLSVLLAYPLSAVEWTSETTGNQTVTENVTVSGTATVGNITFDGGSGSTITVSGEGALGGSGSMTVNSGTVVIDGVSRTSSTGNITVASGSTLELVNGSQILSTSYNNSSVVTISGTLKVDNLQYSSGNFGALRDNTGSIKMNDGSRLEITGGGSATAGVSFQGWGATYTIALAAGEENAPRTLAWNASGTGAFSANNGGGNALNIEVGEYAQLTLGKNIGTGLSLNKTGEGELVLNSTVNLDGGRGMTVSGGTLTFGDNANITSAGDWFIVNESATLDLNDKGVGQGLSLTADGAVLNAQNNEMTITLGETGRLSIGGDATAGHSGTIIMAAGSTVDLGGYVFYNSIDVSAGGELLNAENFRGSVVLGIDDDGNTLVTSDELKIYKNGLASAGSLQINLSEDFESAAPDYDLLKGRLYAADAVTIEGSGEENVSITGYTSAYGAVSAQNGDITITEVGDVNLSDNHAAVDTDADYFTAGALSAAGNVTIDTAGSVVISGNAAEGNSQAAGAIYASSGVSISGADILIEGNTYEGGSGGAVRGDGDAVVLTGTDGSVTIRSNTAEESGGAIYASTGVEISSAIDITIESNTATNSDGGAIYSDADVTITPGEGGKVSIGGNTAGGNGGAIYSYGTVTISGGTYEIKDNTAGGYGGAIYAEDGVDISADAGHVTFSGNTHDGGTANDVELGGGVANLSATNGYTLEMQGGVTGAAELNISTDENSSVKLGGTSSTETLTIENGRVFGINSDSGEQAVINISSSVTLSNAYMQDVALVDEYIEAALTSENSTYIFNNTPLVAAGTYSGDALTYTTTAPLLNGFTTVDGVLSIGLTHAFLQSVLEGANGQPVNVILTLVTDASALAEDGSFSFMLDQWTQEMLAASELSEYGFYDVDNDELLGLHEAQLTGNQNVVFAINGLTKLIPEPTTSTLSLMALSALCLRRRRRRRA